MKPAASAAVAVALPSGTPDWITPELVAETLETWQPYYAEALTAADAVGILRAVGGLADSLSGSPS